MPWRRRPIILEEIERRAARPLGSTGIIALIELFVERIYAMLKIFGLYLFILGICIIGLEVQIQQRNARFEKFKDQLDHTEQILSDAIESGKAGAEDSRSAIDSIHRIEARLCGGPCPTTSTSITP